MEDIALEELLNQLKGNLDAYNPMTLGQCVLNISFINNAKQIILTNEWKNTIFISRELGMRKHKIKSSLTASANINRYRARTKNKILGWQDRLERMSILYQPMNMEKERQLLQLEKEVFQNMFDDLENEWALVAIELNSDIILNQYLDYLFTRTAGDIMSMALKDSETEIGSFAGDLISRDALLKMPILVPTIMVQKNMLRIRKEIDKRSFELNELKKILLQVDQHEVIQAELEKLISPKNRTGTMRTLRELLEHNEDNMLEFKASMWTKYKTVNKIATKEIVKMDKKPYFLQDEILHTVAAFLNTEGGTLLIGVKDKPTSWGSRPAEVFGIEPDYRWLGSNNQGGDAYIQAVYQVLNNGFGDTSTTAKFVEVKIVQFDDKEICRVDVKPLPRVRDGELYINEKTSQEEESFYYRVGDSSQKASMKSATRYIRNTFPGLLDDDGR